MASLSLLSENQKIKKQSHEEPGVLVPQGLHAYYVLKHSTVKEFRKILDEYENYLRVGRKTTKDKAFEYLSGLFTAERGKRNIERMIEQVKGSNYENLQHFITNSPWDSKGLMMQLSQTVSKELMPFGVVGCTVDEKSHLKKGEKSVGVARQYSGTKGKVDNCQVGVYLSLCAGKYASITNYRLFLPKEWTEDKNRCLEAGIPEEKIEYKTKPELALEMIDEHVENGVHFDYVNGDGLYGNGFGFSKGLDRLGMKYVLDVHSNNQIFLEKPNISVPQKEQHKKGPTPKHLKADKISISVSEYASTQRSGKFKITRIRKTTKGWLEAKIHVVKVWVWDEQNKDTLPIEQTLIIRKPIHKKDKPKYSLSNILINEQSPEMFAFMQAQRFWIERCFRDDSHDLGMSDYQVRTYKGFNNHMALTCLAMQFVMRQRIKNSGDVPLLSYNDVRIILADSIISGGKNFDTRYDQLVKRHQQRARDINRYYNVSNLPK